MSEAEAGTTREPEAPELLRDGEERFRLVVEGAKDFAIFMLDGENRIVYWSSGAERVLGWSREQAVGRNGDLIFTPEDRERGEPEKERQVALRDGRAEDRRWHLRADGSRFWADGILTALYDHERRFRGFGKILRDATEQKEAEEALRQAHEELEARVRERTEDLRAAQEGLRTLLRRLVTAEENERRRISRDLHDRTGQDLAALLLDIAALREVCGDSLLLEERLGRLRGLVEGVGEELRRIAFELRPTALDDLGLRRALENYVENWAERTGIPADLHFSGLDGERLPSELETAVYRVVQEALTNVMRHASASRVSVILERAPERLQVIVEDTGRGFETERMLHDPSGTHHVGLLGMRERAALVGGTLTVESATGQGTTIFLRVPFLPTEGSAPLGRNPPGEGVSQSG